MFSRMTRVATISAGFLLGGCDEHNLPPKVFEVASKKSAIRMSECIGAPDGKRAFPGLSYLVTAPKVALSDSTFVAANGIRIQIYARIREPNVVEVRSPQPLTKAQVSFVRSCAA